MTTFLEHTVGFETLSSAGDRLRALPARLGYDNQQELDDASVRLELHDGLVVAIAELGSSALEGFGALIGLKNEFKQALPEGGMMTLEAHQTSDYQPTTVRLLDDKGYRLTVRWTTIAAGMHDGLSLSIWPCEELRTMPTEIYSKIGTPEVASAAADYVLALAERTVNT